MPAIMQVEYNDWRIVQGQLRLSTPLGMFSPSVGIFSPKDRAVLEQRIKREFTLTTSSTKETRYSWSAGCGAYSTVQLIAVATMSVIEREASKFRKIDIKSARENFNDLMRFYSGLVVESGAEGITESEATEASNTLTNSLREIATVRSRETVTEKEAPTYDEAYRELTESILKEIKSLCKAADGRWTWRQKSLCVSNPLLLVSCSVMVFGFTGILEKALGKAEASIVTYVALGICALALFLGVPVALDLAVSPKEKTRNREFVTEDIQSALGGARTKFIAVSQKSSESSDVKSMWQVSTTGR